jgi:hypothetical protein
LEEIGAIPDLALAKILVYKNLLAQQKHENPDLALKERKKEKKMSLVVGV